MKKIIILLLFFIILSIPCFGFFDLNPKVNYAKLIDTLNTGSRQIYVHKIEIETGYYLIYSTDAQVINVDFIKK